MRRRFARWRRFKTQGRAHGEARKQRFLEIESCGLLTRTRFCAKAPQGASDRPAQFEDEQRSVRSVSLRAPVAGAR
ncbi:MAG: hypothetical protein C4334_05170 [Pyrinomonas sp.]